jgi:hypothetical protein
MDIPNTAIAQLIPAIMMMPTTIDMLPPDTADKIWPPMMQLIMLYPTMITIFSSAQILDGQYPIKNRATT